MLSCYICIHWYFDFIISYDIYLFIFFVESHKEQHSVTEYMHFNFTDNTLKEKVG